ncbi:hypothetical protein VTN02DRAFT_1757 [Thermoascus thermophilus]
MDDGRWTIAGIRGDLVHPGEQTGGFLLDAQTAWDRQSPGSSFCLLYPLVD